MYRDVIASIDNPQREPCLSHVMTEANVNHDLITRMIEIGLISREEQMRTKKKPKILLHVRRLGIDFISAYHTLEYLSKVPHV